MAVRFGTITYQIPTYYNFDPMSRSFPRPNEIERIAAETARRFNVLTRQNYYSLTHFSEYSGNKTEKARTEPLNREDWGQPADPFALVSISANNTDNFLKSHAEREQLEQEAGQFFESRLAQAGYGSYIPRCKNE